MRKKKKTLRWNRGNYIIFFSREMEFVSNLFVQKVENEFVKIHKIYTNVNHICW